MIMYHDNDDVDNEKTNPWFMFNRKDDDENDIFDVIPEDDDVNTESEHIVDDLTEDSDIVHTKDNPVRYVMDEFKKDELEFAEQMADAFPMSAEIAANCLKMNNDAEDYENGKLYFDKLMKMDHSCYGITSYTEIIGYLLHDPVLNENDIRLLIKEFSDKYPLSEDCGILQASFEYKLGNTNIALEILEETVKKIPSAPEAALQLAFIQNKLRMYKKAIETAVHAMPTCNFSKKKETKILLKLQLYLAQESLFEEMIESDQDVDHAEVQRLRHKLIRLKENNRFFSSHDYNEHLMNINTVINSLDDILDDISD